MQVGGHAVGILGQLNRSSSSICACWCDDGLPFERGDAGLARYCGLLFCVKSFTVPIFPPCMHLTSHKLLQLAPWSTSSVPSCSASASINGGEEGSDPSTAPPARRDTKISSCRLPVLTQPVIYFYVFSLPSLLASRHGAMHDSGDYPRLQATAESNASESLTA